MALTVIGSNPIIYPKILKIIFKKKHKFLKKFIIKEKNKQIFLSIFSNLIKFFEKSNTFILKKGFLKKPIKFTTIDINNRKNKQLVYVVNKPKNNLIITISQKNHNPKISINIINNNISYVSVLNTFSVGSIMQFFKIKQGKYIRRSIKGSKILLNFLKNFLVKKNLFKDNVTIINICGFNYNLFFLKSKILNIFDFKNLSDDGSIKLINLISLKLTFSKVKSKKIKSIKKRLQKKLLSDFLIKKKI